jgi:pyridoxal phosphate enzyme (YggS family)
MINLQQYNSILSELKASNAQLIAVSKTKPVSNILELYDVGQRVFGENYVQELVDKQPLLPADVQWHFIGHLQSNKVKYIAPFVHTIHAVDSLKLLIEIDKQASKNNRIINCLLQLHIADEATKFGLSENEIVELVKEIHQQNFKNILIIGIMAMATNTDDETKIEKEFIEVKQFFEMLKSEYFSSANSFNQISMGMSSDYKSAIKHGSTMVRIGSLLFGNRN